MDNVQDIILKAKDLTEEATLATVFHVEGSAYRKVGATMLITKNKQTFGTISGGCLEEDLSLRAMELLQNGKVNAKIIRYNMAAEDDNGWGRGAGCNGIISILLEKIQPILTIGLNKVATNLEQGIPVQINRNIKLLSKESINTEQDVEVQLTVIPMQNIPEIPRHQTTRTSRKIVFDQTIEPKPRLLIFGAGKDVPFLAQLAAKTGFKPIVWDWRKAFLKSITYKNIELIHAPSPNILFDQFPLKPRDFLLVMTHDFQMDKQILQLIPQCETVSYLGVLGPSRRTKRLLASIDQPINKVHSPVGLAIGAEGPNEIAISILAELIACKQNMLESQRVFVE